MLFAFKEIQNIVDYCFSIILKSKYLDYISDFQRSYRDLNISITIKFTLFFFHLPDFYPKIGKGIGFFSE